MLVRHRRRVLSRSRWGITALRCDNYSQLVLAETAFENLCVDMSAKGPDAWDFWMGLRARTYFSKALDL